jgi:hypothetical protein
MSQKEIIKRILKEESDELSIDKSILNFLRRHSKIDERNIGDGEHPIKVKSVSFNIDDEWYSISSFMSKKDMKNKILRMLEDNDITRLGEYNQSVLDTDRQKVVRTIKKFINVVMT